MKKIVIAAILLFVILVGLSTAKAITRETSAYYFAGINDSDKFFEGIQSIISYANPNVIGNESFSLEGLMLCDDADPNNTESWVETGWVKDNRYNMSSPWGFLENKQLNTFTYTYFGITPHSHNYKLMYVGQTADHRYVYACYYDGVWEARGFLYSETTCPEVHGEVLRSPSSNPYTQMGPASFSNIKLLHIGSWNLWCNSYPTLHTETFSDNPYSLTIFNRYYNIANSTN